MKEIRMRVHTQLTATSIIAFLVVFFTTDLSLAQRPKPKETQVLGHTMYTLLKPGDIPAIFEPEFITIDEADSLYWNDEILMVVTDGKTTKGYSAWHLDHHEVVNDFLGGVAIAVTW
ncbi:MAG: DUF3179 domain-containing protein [candidate division Zixibacteria bacterium]|nr:DUF3179 domain-containing protein [candidate division Zixibacteria bacterium]